MWVEPLPVGASFIKRLRHNGAEWKQWNRTTENGWNWTYNCGAIILRCGLLTVATAKYQPLGWKVCQVNLSHIAAAAWTVDTRQGEAILSQQKWSHCGMGCWTNWNYMGWCWPKVRAVTMSLKGPVPIWFWDRTLNWYSVAGDRPVTSSLVPAEGGTGTENQSCFPSLSLAEIFFTLQREKEMRTKEQHRILGV